METNEVIDYNDFLFQPCDSISFELVKLWLKKAYNFRFCRSLQDAKDLINNGTEKDKTVDAYALIAALPDLISDKVTQELSPLPNRIHLYSLIEQYVGKTADKKEIWISISNALDKINETEQSAIAGAFYEKLRASIRRGAGSSSEGVSVIFVRATGMTLGDEGMDYLPKVGNQAYVKEDFFNYIVNGPAVTQENIDQISKQVMAALVEGITKKIP